MADGCMQSRPKCSICRSPTAKLFIIFTSKTIIPWFVKCMELRNPGQYTAAWKDDNKLYQLTEDALTEARVAHSTCIRTKRVISPAPQTEKIVSPLLTVPVIPQQRYPFIKINFWIGRGWDANGKQMWGAEKMEIYLLNQTTKQGRMIKKIPTIVFVSLCCFLTHLFSRPKPRQVITAQIFTCN